jgi:hypothetical protein
MIENYTPKEKESEERAVGEQEKTRMGTESYGLSIGFLFEKLI